MSELLTLREAGIPYPDISILPPISRRLANGCGYKSAFAGGLLRDLVLLGHTRHTPDIDVFFHIEDYNAFKPKEEGAEDLRDHFFVHPKHANFIIRMLVNGTFHEAKRPMVMDLKPEYMTKWNLDIPIGMILTKDPVVIPEVIADVDLGFNEIVSNGEEIWVTPAFMKDRANKTMTMRRYRDKRDFERTTLRVERFRAQRYPGWQFIIPEEFQHCITK